jgi:hypothetical protein
MDEPASRRLTPAEVITEEQLRAYVRLLMEARTNVRAVAAETGLSKTTVNELRMGRRRISLDALSKVVGVYAANELGEARAAWQRVQPERRRAGTAPAPVDPDAMTAGAPVSGAEDPAAAHPVPISPAAAGQTDGVAPIGEQPLADAAANRWLPVGLAPRLVYLVIAVLAAVTLVQAGIGVLGLRPEDASTVLGTATAPCISAGQDTHAAISALPGAKSSRVGIEAFAYHLQRTDPPRLEIAGELTGPLASDQALQLLEWADPGTVDSTSEHHPGNGRYYPRKAIRVVGRCVYVPQQEIGYAGFAGIRLRYTVVLLPKRFADALIDDAYAADGLPEQDLSRYQVVELGSFELRP